MSYDLGIEPCVLNGVSKEEHAGRWDGGKEGKKGSDEEEQGRKKEGEKDKAGSDFRKKEERKDKRKEEKRKRRERREKKMWRGPLIILS